MRMAKKFQIKPGFFCVILEILRSTFLCNNGKTSFWSVTITSHPNKAMPAMELQIRLGITHQPKY